MQREKRQVEAYKEEPEVPFSKGRVRHSTGHLGEPEIDAREHREKSAADKNIMKVRDHKVGIVNLQIHRNGSQHHSRQSSDQKYEEESKAPEHGQTKLKPSIPYGGYPAEELHPGRNHDH